MEITKHVLYAFSISIAFLLVHIVIAYFKLSNGPTFILTMVGMLLAQTAIFMLIDKQTQATSFLYVFLMLALT